MNSSNWLTLCYISLTIGILLFVAAGVFAIKFKVISIIVYERKARKKNYDSNEPKAPDITFDMPDGFYESTVKMPQPPVSEPEHNAAESAGDDFTVVVSQKTTDECEGTVVVGRNKPEPKAENDFVIIRKIVVTSAAADEIEKL
ncbi:MAG: hypothetical protein MJ100_05960 [Ruminococcus sp.]|nr:hypothetical protein [Ruminococcus sp.]